MKLFLTANITVHLDDALSDDLRPNFIFSSSGALVSYGKIDQNTEISSIIDATIGSDHWMSDNSDFFRFDASGKMHSLILSVSERNSEHPPKVPHGTQKKHSLKLIDLNQAFTVAPQPHRFFDYKNRILYGFNEEKTTLITNSITICDEFLVLFDENNLYSGWAIKNPIEKIADSLQDRPEFKYISDATYNVFNIFLKLFSDNSYDEADGEIEIVISNLEKKLNKSVLLGIENEKIRMMIITAIEELKEYHCKSS